MKNETPRQTTESDPEAKPPGPAQFKPGEYRVKSGKIYDGLKVYRPGDLFPVPDARTLENVRNLLDLPEDLQPKPPGKQELNLDAPPSAPVRLVFDEDGECFDPNHSAKTWVRLPPPAMIKERWWTLKEAARYRREGYWEIPPPLPFFGRPVMVADPTTGKMKPAKDDLIDDMKRAGRPGGTLEVVKHDGKRCVRPAEALRWWDAERIPVHPETRRAIKAQALAEAEAEEGRRAIAVAQEKADRECVAAQAAEAEDAQEKAKAEKKAAHKWERYCKGARRTYKAELDRAGLEVFRKPEHYKPSAFLARMEKIREAFLPEEKRLLLLRLQKVYQAWRKANLPPQERNRRATPARFSM